jgi:Leucine-rich repeat (LRR) protein
MKKDYLCADGKHLNITGTHIEGLRDEPYLPEIEWMQVTEVAHAVKLDYSVFTNLRELIISSLEPFVFPKEICNLPLLKHIRCSGRCLVPDEIGAMLPLQDLDVTGDCVLQMPETILELSSLKRLGVSYYNYPIRDSIPCAMPRWISKMSGLEQLYLHLCHFSDIDPNINNLQNLKHLCFWNALSAIADFPSLCGMPKLSRLEITGDGRGLPKPKYSLFESVLENIKDLSTLESLRLSEWSSRKKADYLILTDRGKSIPDVFDRYPELTMLDISYMRIDFLPPSVFRLPKLKFIYAGGNSLPAEELEQLTSRGVEINLS